MQIRYFRFCCFILLGWPNVFGTVPPQCGSWVTDSTKELSPFNISEVTIQNNRNENFFYSGCGPKGNVLFTNNNNLTYLSGNFPYLTTDNSKIRQYRTMVHIILGDKVANELMLAYRLFIYMKTNSAECYRVIVEQFLNPETKNFLELLNVDILAIQRLDTYQSNFAKLKENLKKAINDTLKEYIECSKMQEYIDANGQDITLKFKKNIAFPIADSVRDGKKVFTQLTHTERMLIYDYRTNESWPPSPMIIYSRKAMCETCEPAIVTALRDKDVLVVAELEYDDKRHSRNDPTSKVKKIIIPRVPTPGS